MAGNNIHEGHRQRMRAKYEKYGAAVFETHQLMEMLLFNSIRQGDTNPLAHRILDAYLAGAVDACTPSELTCVEGVGNATANLLCISADTTVALLLDMLKREPLSSDFSRKAFMWLWLKNKGEKTVGALLLDSKSRMIDCVCIARGKSIRPEVYSDAVLGAAKRCGTDSVRSVIIAHNHKNNDKDPSAEDIYLTGYLSKELSEAGIQLLAHYIVTDSDCIECVTDQ